VRGRSVEEDQAEGDDRRRSGDTRCPADPQDDPARLGETAVRPVQDGPVDLGRDRSGRLKESPQVPAEPVRHAPLQVIELSVVLGHSQVLLNVKHTSRAESCTRCGFFPCPFVATP
jgi:hypothetical protein